MNGTTVSIAEGKKGLSGLVRAAEEKNREFILTRRGKPVAALISYGDYLASRKEEARRRIMEARAAFEKAGVKACEIHAESKRQLHKRP